MSQHCLSAPYPSGGWFLCTTYLTWPSLQCRHRQACLSALHPTIQKTKRKKNLVSLERKDFVSLERYIFFFSVKFAEELWRFTETLYFVTQTGQVKALVLCLDCHAGVWLPRTKSKARVWRRRKREKRKVLKWKERSERWLYGRPVPTPLAVSTC